MLWHNWGTTSEQRKPVLKAEAGPAEYGAQGRYVHAVGGPGGTGSPGSSLHRVPGLSPGHSTVHVLTYLPFPFLSLPAGTRSPGPSLLRHLLPLLPLRQNLGGQVPLKVTSHSCVALSSPPPAARFSAWASAPGSRVAPPWPSSETPASSVCSDVSSLLSHRQPLGCCWLALGH